MREALGWGAEAGERGPRGRILDRLWAGLAAVGEGGATPSSEAPGLSVQGHGAICLGRAGLGATEGCQDPWVRMPTGLPPWMGSGAQGGARAASV